MHKDQIEYSVPFVSKHSPHISRMYLFDFLKTLMIMASEMTRVQSGKIRKPS